jgi:hypothetical protein
MGFFKTYYRVVTDDGLMPFQVQTWNWYFPVWWSLMFGGADTLERAKEKIAMYCAPSPPPFVPQVVYTHGTCEDNKGGNES